MRHAASPSLLLLALATSFSAVIVGLAGCPEKHPKDLSIILQPCDPEVCDAPKQCRPVDGVKLCVFTCPGAVPGTEQVCGVDQFIIDPTGPVSCACVGLSPTGRACESDADCPYGPGESGVPHICAILAGGSKTCQPLGTSCGSDVDCRAGHTCDLSNRVCVKVPAAPEISYRRDADGDKRCTNEKVSALAPGPGAGWRADCAGEEQPRCDLNPLYTCEPGELEVTGSALRVGTVYTPGVNFKTEGGVRYNLAGELASLVARFEGGNRLQLSGRVTGPSGTGIDNFEVHWFTVIELAGGDQPLLGRLRFEGGQPYLYTASRGKVLLSTKSTSIAKRMNEHADWEVWVVGKDDGGAHRIWRFGEIYKPAN